MYLARTRTTKHTYGNFKYKNDSKASRDDRQCQYKLAGIKLQQSENLQQQKLFCNNCKKYASNLLENTMKI